MPKYRKKPVVVEAVQWLGSNEEEVCSFMDHKGYQISNDGALIQLHIWTLEGNHLATVNDFIIKGVKGEFYPCKPDIFAATYEEADPDSVISKPPPPILPPPPGQPLPPQPTPAVAHPVKPTDESEKL